MQCRHFTVRLSPEHLIDDEERLNTFLRQVRVHSVQSSLVAPKGERWSLLVFFEQEPVLIPAPAPRREESPPASELAAPELSAGERRIYERLREWRLERARAEGVPPYVVAHNAALLQIARQHLAVAAAEDLAPIKQFGAQRASRYGADILRVLRAEPDGEALFEDDYAR
jgi:superfamily II DNA helicase RecQ